MLSRGSNYASEEFPLLEILTIINLLVTAFMNPDSITDQATGCILLNGKKK